MKEEKDVQPILYILPKRPIRHKPIYPANVKGDDYANRVKIYNSTPKSCMRRFHHQKKTF
jgi:hypothetical protein